jgi:hypothetical protein
LGGKLEAFEFKWNEKKIARLPAKFADAYPDTSFKVINRDNFWKELF